MVVDRGSVCIRNVVTKGPPVHEVNVPPNSLYSAIYSKVFDRLVIMSCSGNYFTTLDVKTGAPYTVNSNGEPISPIPFSRTAKQLVCSGETSGLEMVDISTGRRIRFNFLATVTSISTLSNGTVLANIPISSIQLLVLDQEHASPPQHTPTLAVYPLDKGRIITIVPTTDDRLRLLETATMSQVFPIPAQKFPLVATVLYASLESKIVVHCFAEVDKGYLQMWEFSRQHPRWTVRTGELAFAGSISPACTRLVTIHNGSSGGSVRV